MKSAPNKHVQGTVPETLPVIPTMDVVVFPHMLVPLLVIDEKIIQGIEKAVQGSKLALLLAVRKNNDKNGTVGTKDLYQVGTIASIMRVIKIPEGGIKVLIQGIGKARALEVIADETSLTATIEPLQPKIIEQPENLTAQIRAIKELAEKISLNGTTFSPDFNLIISKMNDPEKIADFILSHLAIDIEQAQALLETDSMEEFLAAIYHHLSKEIEVSEIQEKIKNNARESMNKSQKEYYLREQMRAIRKELGDDDAEEVAAMRVKAEQLLCPEETRAEILRQIGRLERIAADSMEGTVQRNYIEWLLALPWGIETDDNLDLTHAKKVLDEDHYGLEDVKDRILDYISVRNLKQDGYAPILCLIGPPGTGKTSLGKSIAASLGRKYARISLGGVRDEAEIRGHRRTYVGAMPGRFIQAIRKAESSNPVIIIDELDKIGADFRGDPAAAMLEVLEQHQNKTFYDNYLGVPYDLSKVMFIATANTADTISGPLRDRMEIIDLSGYTLEEKVHIAQKHLLKRAITNAGLEKQNLKISEEVITDIITNYTKESGVRQCERILNKLCSKIARAIVEQKKVGTITNANLEKFLGPRKFMEDELSHDDQVGITNGLAWTAYGGEMLKIEAALMPGSGKLMLTGHLGEIMKESAQAALSYARVHADDFGIPADKFTQCDLHIHVPAGAIPKDGPSAGITMLTSILSALTERPISAKYAMTGELNLRGEVMPIGGVKEKILAAKRNHVSYIILPNQNKHDLVGIEDITKDIDVIWVKHADEVMKHVLLDKRNSKARKLGVQNARNA